MITTLRDEISRAGLLIDPQVNEGIIFGRAHVAAAGSEVWFNVDPELGDDSAPDTTALLHAIQSVLTLTLEQWEIILGEVVAEIEAAVGDEPIDETIPLRNDLALNSVVVFADATLLRFEAPRQFPDSWVQVQLDEDFTLDDLTIEEKDEEGEDEDAERFTSLDQLLDHPSETD